MPLTLEEKSYVLKKNGFDPSLYDLTEGGAVVELPTTTSPVPSVAGSTPPSVLSSALGGAQRNIGGTVGGLGATALGIALAPETGGLSLAIPLIAGLAGSYAGAKGQQVAEQYLLSPDTQAKMAAEAQAQQAAHPVAEFLGGFAPQALFLRPPGGKELSNIGSAIRKGMQAPTGLTSLAGSLSNAERAALANLALGSGIGGATEAAGQLISGQEIDPTKIALATAGGAAFS